MNFYLEHKELFWYLIFPLLSCIVGGTVLFVIKKYFSSPLPPSNTIMSGQNIIGSNNTINGFAAADEKKVELPEEYHQERERILNFYLNRAKNDRGNLDGTYVEIKSKFTGQVFDDLEKEGLLAKYSRGSEVIDRYIDGSYMRCITPYFREHFKEKLK